MSQSAQSKKAQRDLKTEAAKIVRAINIQGENRSETQRIVAGVQRGIEYHLKQHSARARELDKKAKKLRQVDAGSDRQEAIVPVTNTRFSSAPLAWGLLAVSWAGFIAYLIFEAWF